MARLLGAGRVKANLIQVSGAKTVLARPFRLRAGRKCQAVQWAEQSRSHWPRAIPFPSVMSGMEPKNVERRRTG